MLTISPSGPELGPEGSRDPPRGAPPGQWTRGFQEEDGTETLMTLQDTMSPNITALLEQHMAKPYFAVRTNSNIVSIDMVEQATREQGSYCWRGFSKPHERDTISRMQKGDEILIVHTLPAARSGAVGIATVLETGDYIDESLVKRMGKLTIALKRRISPPVPGSVLAAMGRTLGVEMFDHTKHINLAALPEEFMRTLEAYEAGRRDSKG